MSDSMNTDGNARICRTRPALIGVLNVLVGSVVACSSADSVKQRENAENAILQLRLGNDEQMTTLSTITDLAVSDELGRIAVAQPQEGQIRVFTINGAFIGTFGRKGAGPGEFQSVMSVGFRGDNLWAFDNVMMRITEFDPNGNVTRTVSPRLPYAGTVLPVKRGLLVFPNLGRAQPIEDGSFRIPVTRADDHGTIADTVGFISFPSPPAALTRVGGRRITWTNPIPDQTLLSVMPSGEGLAFLERGATDTSTGQAVLHMVETQGDTLWTYVVHGTPRPVEPNFIENRVSAMSALLPKGARGSDALKAYRENITIPTHYPLFDRVIVASDDEVWLRQSPGLSDTFAVWSEIVGGRERRTGRIVHLPIDVKVYRVSGRSFWGVAVDSLDVPYVVRYGTTLPR